MLSLPWNCHYARLLPTPPAFDRLLSPKSRPPSDPYSPASSSIRPPLLHPTPAPCSLLSPRSSTPSRRHAATAESAPTSLLPAFPDGRPLALTWRAPRQPRSRPSVRQWMVPSTEPYKLWTMWHGTPPGRHRTPRSQTAPALSHHARSPSPLPPPYTTHSVTTPGATTPHSRLYRTAPYSVTPALRSPPPLSQRSGLHQSLHQIVIGHPIGMPTPSN